MLPGRYAQMAARTTTREAMTKGTVNRLREHGIQLARVSAHQARDFCIYYENVIVSIGPEPHPAARSPAATAVAAEGLAIYPPMLLCEAALRCEARVSAIGGGPPFHCYSAK
jgi:hypothetical protein